MKKNIFLRAGLTPTQALILEYLYTKKEDKASNISKAIKKSRAIVYKDLDELASLKIIEKFDKANQVSIFRIGHPSYMEKYFDKEADKLKKDKELFNSYLPDMVSAYNLMSNKPGVRYYEGMEGVKKVINDTFTATETIYSYADIETINKYLKDINKEYTKKRDTRNLKKKIIFSDTPYTRDTLKNYHTKTTESRIIQDLSNFYTVVQIYDNKISYVTISDDVKIGIIIENTEIYKTNRVLFEAAWENALTMDQI